MAVAAPSTAAADDREQRHRLRRGNEWGTLNGLLAVSALKDRKLRMMRFDQAGAYRGTYVPPELDGRYGRLRAAVMGPDGALDLTTSNGSDDKIVKVVPTPR